MSKNKQQDLYMLVAFYSDTQEGEALFFYGSTVTPEKLLTNFRSIEGRTLKEIELNQNINFRFPSWIYKKFSPDAKAKIRDFYRKKSL